MTNSDHYPSPERLQGSIIVPYQITQEERDGQPTYNYLEHRIPDTGQSFEEAEHKAALLDLLRIDEQAYLDARYDPYVRESFQALYADPATPQAVKDALAAVWAWVRAVAGYYYQQQALIQAGANNWKSGAWDFSQFDKSDPCVDLVQLMAM